MLRALVLLFLIINAALFYWLQGDPHALQSDREPQRLGRQVAPDAIRVLPDLTVSGSRAATSSAGATSSATGGADAAVAASSAASAAASDAVSGLAHKTSAVDVDCAETPPIDDVRFATLKTALTRAGVPLGAIADRHQAQGGAWIVYLGRFADSQTWQRKADELQKLEVKFDRVNTPTTLAPGLSLGQFSSQPDAARKLDDLAKHGVHGAKVVTLTAPVMLRHLQVRAADPAWRHATGAQRFNSCPVDALSNT